MPIRLKHGVKIDAISPQIVLAISVADSILRELPAETVVTSCNDAVHRRGSLHNVGQAVDLRTRHIGNVMAETFTGQLRSALGAQFDVVLESDHIHVEYQPKVAADRPL